MRPSGNAGPVAASLDAFRLYHAESAWTWEHMALTRARVVTGDGDLPARLQTTIHDVLTRDRAPDRVLLDVAEMRDRLERSHPGDSLWNVKYLRGGLIDVEFIAQYLELRYAHTEPQVLSAATGEALERLSQAGHLPADDARLLIEAERLWRALLGMLRLTMAGPFDEEQAPPGLKMALAKAAGVENFDALKQHMERTARAVFAIFNHVIADPARRMSGGAVRAHEGERP
jgi:glutamate-ammonia-ligase adenylyltransferase